MRRGAESTSPVAFRGRAAALTLTLSAPLLLASLVAPRAPAEDYAHTAALTAFGLGARPLGMGGAFVAVADDASSLYYNPAGLAAIHGREMTSMYASQFGVLVTF